ncbi:hypothetical protein [Acrocarpospora catenulata]|uniref:hypothetical protein n=1 Tax=Acrocarpospora catenulata TaxID=2836182 RepID=UPI001BDAC796|nr:hypothetical protein [Acrocarpospora catenulata]
MTESNDRPDPLGAAADEAKRLFDSLQQRVGREIGKGFVRGAGSGFGGMFAPPPPTTRQEDVWAEAVSGHDHEEYICRACPVCRVIAARKEKDARGDVTDHLIAAGGELLAAFRQAVDALQGPPAPRRPDDPKVEHIDLG